MHIVMVAAENGALPGGKVGGIGDVIRDVPHALAAGGDTVTVITPGYQSLSRLPGAVCINSLSVIFDNGLFEVFLYRLENAERDPGITELVLDCAEFAPCGEGNIYCHDGDEPFALDATKFALFCSAVGVAIVSGAVASPDVVHLHDWHTALLLFLRRWHPAFDTLRAIPCVYTIHNLSIQGIRPLRDNPSSLQAWFGELDYPADAIRDPRYPDCVNLMRLGINLADRVHVVSPTYAREILQPSDYAHGFIGGEGLEGDLQAVAADKRLFGILNGCEYAGIDATAPAAPAVIDLALDTLQAWVDDREWIRAAHFHAWRRLQQWRERQRPVRFTAVSIGRLNGQKMHLLREQTHAGQSALADILAYLAEHDGLYLMIGSGDARYEQFMRTLMQQHANFVFLNGFSEALADALYRFGTLFLMPSSFEPCGISQMLAMRAGVPCLVHRTGGLADTVKNGQNGFSFAGRTPRAQARNLVATFKRAHALCVEEPGAWRTICDNARAARFTWDAVVADYRRRLYGES